MERAFIGKTYDDFLFKPRKGIVNSRSDISLTTKLTNHLNIQLPIVSANMDSVTDSPMAKAMALQGGIGFIHRGKSIPHQAVAIEEVKRTHGFIIELPLSLPMGTTIGEARSFTRKYNITGILIERVKNSEILAGMLSNRDIPPGHNDDIVDKFMTPVDELCVASSNVTMKEAENILFNRRIEKLPLVNKNFKILGLITKKDINLHRHQPYTSKDNKGRLLVGATIGATGDYLERAADAIHVGADVILIDIAHGHSTVMQKAIKAFRSKFPDVNLICGNVGTGEGALFLKNLGADGIKVGIGSGYGCRTRLETGVGVPQLQAIRETWNLVGESTPIIADGGVKNDKDIFLALVCGASSVMLGSFLSGTDESPGSVIKDPETGYKKKIYRGMTSPQAVFSTTFNEEDLEKALETPAEGQEFQIPYKGSVVEILQRVRGHLQSAISYAGVSSLEELRRVVVTHPLSYLIPLSGPARNESYNR